MLSDLKFAFRQLAKSPGFSAAAILTLALGIGANTAIFSLVHDLFLRGLSFTRPEEIVRVYAEAPERNLRQLPFGVPRFETFRASAAAQSVFTEMAADAGAGFAFTGRGDPVQVGGARVTANYFSLLGVTPARGRLFRVEEETAADVALVSESFWRTQLDGAPDVIGRNITLNGVAHTVVGVLPPLPPAWWGPNAQVWTTKPFEQPGLAREVVQRGVSFMRGIGRLKPGVTIEQALAAMKLAHEAYRKAYPENADNSWQPVILTATEDTVGNLRPAFTTLLAAVGCVLLIACSNVANLLLARFAGRRREIAVRTALGAARGSIVRLFIVESVTVALLAGAVGLLFAQGALQLVPRLADNLLPLTTGLELHPPVVFFALVVALVTGMAMGVYPALQGSRADVVDGLKDGGRTMAGSRSQQRFRRLLLGSQVALSLVLLVGAALLGRSFIRLQRQEAGFRHDHTWVAALNLPTASYPDAGARERFADRLLAELRRTPGVEHAALGQGLPLTGADSRSPYARETGEVAPVARRPLGYLRSITPGYLKTFGIPLVTGRDFDERDAGDKPFVVLISRAAAARLFPNENPLGQRLYFGANNGTGQLCEIVGIVGDVRSVNLAQPNDVEFYRPWAHRSGNFLQLAVRVPGEPAAATSLVRAALRTIDPELPLTRPTTMDAIVANSVGQQRLLMALLGVFATVALLLALVGIYSLVAYSVTQRTAEIGVRLALGAQPADVLRLIVRQGMTPVLLGLAAGLVAALALGRLLATQLYEVSAYDPVTLSLTTLTLALVAILACWFPARRAMKVDPISALRTE